MEVSKTSFRLTLGGYSASVGVSLNVVPYAWNYVAYNSSGVSIRWALSPEESGKQFDESSSPHVRAGVVAQACGSSCRRYFSTRGGCQRWRGRHWEDLAQASLNDFPNVGTLPAVEVSGRENLRHPYVMKLILYGCRQNELGRATGFRGHAVSCTLHPIKDTV